MPNQQIGAILAKISATCTFPTAAELDDSTCQICLHDSLGVRGTEHPVKLRCGHILGMNCLLNWASTDNASRAVCPFCRTPFLTPGAVGPGRQWQGTRGRGVSWTVGYPRVALLLFAGVIARNCFRAIRLLLRVCILSGLFVLGWFIFTYVKLLVEVQRLERLERLEQLLEQFGIGVSAEVL